MFLQSKTLWKQTAANNDLYLEEEGLEGSGGSDREVKSDLESSGSGYGPGEDDEDGDQGSGAHREFVLCVDNAKLDTHYFFSFSFFLFLINHFIIYQHFTKASYYLFIISISES